MAADVAQRGSSRIKSYASAFNNILTSRRPTRCVRIYKYFERAFVHIDFEYTHRPEHNIAV